MRKALEQMHFLIDDECFFDKMYFFIAKFVNLQLLNLDLLRQWIDLVFHETVCS